MKAAGHFGFLVFWIAMGTSHLREGDWNWIGIPAGFAAWNAWKLFEIVRGQNVRTG